MRVNRMKTINTILWLIFAFFCPTCEAVQKVCESELDTIVRAAIRNECTGKENFRILLAVRLQENGGPGKEFGIKHPRAWGTDLDTQAGWAAATITKSRFRWRVAGRPSEFIYFLADRYCPKECDRVGHINWKKNVKYWFERLKNGNDTI